MKKALRITIRVRIKSSTKAAFGAIAERYEMNAGQVVDSLLERWVLDNDAQIAKHCGIVAPKANPFLAPVQSVSVYPAVQAEAVEAVIPITQRPDLYNVIGSKRVLPSAVEKAEDVPNAEMETPPSKRKREVV